MRRIRNTNNKNNSKLLTILLKEWDQTIEEAKIYFEADKDIIKQTILLTITVFASIVLFVTSDKINNDLKVSIYPTYLLVPVLYLTLSVYSYYHTFLRYMISKYWLENLFPRLEYLVQNSSSTIDKGISNNNSEKSLKFLQYQSYYRQNLNIPFKIGIFLYRSMPVLLGLISSLVYLIFVIPALKDNPQFAKYISPGLQTIILGFLLFCFFIYNSCVGNF